MSRTARFVLCLTLAILSTPTTASWAGPPTKSGDGEGYGIAAAPPKANTEVTMVTANAAADREAIGPGDAFNLLVTLKIVDGVHVYWRNPGGPGLPTKIEWSGPKGFLFGRTQFPAPVAVFDKALKETSLVHEGTVQFITQVKAPADLQVGETARFHANVTWLSCRKGACVPGGTTLTLAIPTAAAAKPAGESVVDEFGSARVMLPSPPEKAEHLKITSRIDKKQVKPGESFHAIVTVQIEAKHHMQSDKPLEEYLIPALVFVEPVRDGDIGKIKYPASHIRNDPMMGKMSEYSGKVDFTIPITLDKETDNQPRWVRGILQSQICSDNGTCFAPQYLEFAIPVQMEGGPAPAASPDKFVERVASATVEAGGASESRNVVEATGDNESATVEEIDSAKSWIAGVQDWFISFGYVGVLFLAFLGGIILNLMPCVLPVISLKILSYVRQADEDRSRIFVLGLAYCTGILVFFGIISWLYYSGGQSWGQHFQSPYVVLILAAVITAFALSLFGVFAVFTPKFVNQLGVKAEEREGLPSAFFTGLLATILGTACTGPFMSAAVGAASRFSALQGAMIFMAVGVGMMLPFLVLSANPAWLKFVPKPGKWMGIFEAVMGFALFATVIFLLNPIRPQLGDWGLLLSLMFLLGVAIAVWLRGKAQFTTNPSYRLPLNLAALAMLAVAWLVPFRTFSSVDKLRADAAEHKRLYNIGLLTERMDPDGSGKTARLPMPKYPPDKIDWLPYDKSLVQRYVEAGHTVFVDFTAAWCATCQGNLISSIDIQPTRDLLRDLKVIPLEADYSSRDPKILKIIKSYGRAGVPMYLVFAPFEPDNPQVLDEVLTPGTMAAALKKAGPSTPGNKVASAATAEKTPPTVNTDAQ
ncbi:MAG: thioredoxin family protein [Phycisphaerales bacterium]|nr:thioredoxin family protein [Phycisphaerales bacterium]